MYRWKLVFNPKYAGTHLEVFEVRTVPIPKPTGPQKERGSYTPGQKGKKWTKSRKMRSVSNFKHHVCESTFKKAPWDHCLVISMLRTSKNALQNDPVLSRKRSPVATSILFFYDHPRGVSPWERFQIYTETHRRPCNALNIRGKKAKSKREQAGFDRLLLVLWDAHTTVGRSWPRSLSVLIL